MIFLSNVKSENSTLNAGVDSEKLSSVFRAKVIEMSHAAKAAHLASSLSCLDLVTVLYHSILNIDPHNPNWEGRDRFILSKGHAATALYVALAYKGFFSQDDLNAYCKAGSLLEEHPSPKLEGVEAATGSLGHGLPIGCGMALAGRIKKLLPSQVSLFSLKLCETVTSFAEWYAGDN